MAKAKRELFTVKNVTRCFELLQYGVNFLSLDYMRYATFGKITQQENNDLGWVQKGDWNRKPPHSVKMSS